MRCTWGGVVNHASSAPNLFARLEDQLVRVTLHHAREPALRGGEHHCSDQAEQQQCNVKQVDRYAGVRPESGRAVSPESAPAPKIVQG